jgi:hypothetical protein
MLDGPQSEWRDPRAGGFESRTDDPIDAVEVGRVALRYAPIVGLRVVLAKLRGNDSGQRKPRHEHRAETLTCT